jgi:hypothetical protein
VNPIRGPTAGTNILFYNTSTREITYNAKSFIIDHPLHKDKYLVHGCLEGPEAGIYYRGEAAIKDGESLTVVDLPDYVNALGYDFTVQITPIFSGRKRTETYEASRVSSGKFAVYGPPGEFFWLVHAKRSDFGVEPLKYTVSVKGDGPYKWI